MNSFLTTHPQSLRSLFSIRIAVENGPILIPIPYLPKVGFAFTIL